MTNGCGDGGGGSWTPAEKAEVDKYIREYGRDAIARYLIDTNQKGEQPDFKYIKHFASQGANVNAKDVFGRTPLHWAAICGNIEAIKFLVSQGADVNARDSKGYTPLHQAARGNIEAVKFLVSKGADVNAKNILGGTPADVASGNKEIAIATLDEIAQRVTPADMAKGNGNVEVIKFLESKGTDVNAKDSNGETPADADYTTMSMHAKDIYNAIVVANTERAPLGLGPVWPKSGKPMEDAKDIGDMTFANSSDYFSVLYDWKTFGTSDWAPYVHVNKFDYSKCAGAGVPPKTGGGHLTAKNNAWTIAANITDDTPDIIPVIVSRNVDPSSLIPREGDLSEQFLRPSKHKTPFGNKAFVMIRKGGAIYHATWRDASLDRLYQGASGKELQAIRDAFQKIKYLEP
ncbi:MAG: ankyrin repeat domain-containing protein [Kiritimatiellaeota bacterium]|nr:ankyrin repeat domain-containing protein [Kiritimatiellota bacterium]